MEGTPLKTRLFWLAEGVLLAGCVALALHFSNVSEWQPVLLVILLGTLCLAGDRLSSSVGGGILTPGHNAAVLAICLLGPGPAVAFQIANACAKSALRRLPPSQWLANNVALSTYALAGGLLARVLVGNIHEPAIHHATNSIVFGLVVFAISLFTISVNFTLVSLDIYFDEGRPLLRQFRDSFVPLLPGHLAGGVLAALLAVAYTNLGLPVLVAAAVVLGTFHYLTAALLRSEDRADQLEARSIHLANLQVGVLSMLMNALSLRDQTTSRHAAAVARYAKALAVEVGCDEDEQEVVHTAALLHDIGKFTWSDRVLHPTALDDDDWAVIRRHPQDGAALVGKLDGYGPIADAILYHHERVDGGGYPAGLIGNEIPLASRIIAICSTYDTMTARSTHAPPIPPEEAIVELRRAAGSQLDGELVERFVAMIERDGMLTLDDEGYESEINFTERARRMAQPSHRG